MIAIPALLIAAEGWHRRWVTDDAYIDFRVVSNIASGHGPVFNPGERVEVYTDPLWVAVLTVAHYLSFISIEWWAVMLGLAFTTLGVVFGGRGAQLFGATTDPQAYVVAPVGMLAFASIDASWDFATSGMETGLIFLWLGLSWWLMARRASGRSPLTAVALAIGIGPLIRPDLALLSLCLLVGTLAVETADMARSAIARRVLFGFIVSFAVPALYELWRMMFFALLVPNTALAKSAGSSWWSQGNRYLDNFVGPYWLWFPLLLAAFVVATRVIRLRRCGDTRMGILIAAPIVGGLLNAVYVIRVGGDFMHGRMLLPSFFAICLAFYVCPRSVRNAAVGAVGVIWAVFAVTLLHYPETIKFSHGIANERAFYIAVSGSPHPVTPADYRHSSLGKIGIALKHAEMTNRKPGTIHVLLSSSGSANPSIDAPGDFPGFLVAPLINIGVEALAAGPRVYIFDELSLANPIGSHLREVVHSRPGHSQVALPLWMVARFVPPGDGPVADQPIIQQARAALTCGLMRDYLRAITRPLSPRRMASNFLHAFRYSTFTMSPDPGIAEREMCGRRRSS